MKIALLFGIFSPSSYHEILQQSKGVIQNAADALQKAYIDGIGSLIPGDVEILNLPYIGSYPKRYAHLYSPQRTFSIRTKNGNIVLGQDIRFNNICGLKMFFRYVQAKKALSKWCEKHNDEDRCVVVYAIHAPFLQACADVKRSYPSLKIVLIVPDLPEYMSQRPTILKKLADQINRKILNKLYDCVDGYVLLSRYMIERLPIGDKPWTVIEGIYCDDIQSEKIQTSINIEHSKYILYSGTLARRYGVLNLVEAFRAIPQKEYKLLICGAGDSADIIKKYAKEDERIVFCGQRKRGDVLDMQKKASLLVNPRTPEGEFTKYSFPSKTIEYFASGVPCLLYRLPGIPNEYYQYCFCVDEIGIKPLRQKIEHIIQKDEQALKQVGIQAQHYIFEEKNSIKQTQKLINLIYQLI